VSWSRVNPNNNFCAYLRNPESGIRIRVSRFICKSVLCIGCFIYTSYRVACRIHPNSYTYTKISSRHSDSVSNKISRTINDQIDNDFIRTVSVCVLCGSPVWPSPPVVGPLWGPPLCVGPLCGSPVRAVPCVGPLCGSPVWVPSVWVPYVGPLCGSLVALRHVASTRVMPPARLHAPAYAAYSVQIPSRLTSC